MAQQYFTSATMDFLQNLSDNNNRNWFEANKPAYEETVRAPALQFIADMADDLPVLSRHFTAIPKKTGGSLMRVHRDVRFSKDKRPYKTNIGIHFRHELAKNMHAPGFYVHIEPGRCFIGAGIWRPDTVSLGKIRKHISEQAGKWSSVLTQSGFRKNYELRNDFLTRPPRGYSNDHPMIEELKRKDFIAISPVNDRQMLTAGFKKMTLDSFGAAQDYMQFLCRALDVRY